MQPWQLQSKCSFLIVFENAINALIYITIITFLTLVTSSFLLKRRVKILLSPLLALKEKCVRIAGGDLTTKIPIEKNDEVGEMSAAVLQISESLKLFIKEAKASGDNIETASNQLNSSSQAMSTHTNQAAGVTEEISSNMEEMAASIQQTSDKSLHIKDDAIRVAEIMKGLVEGAELATTLQLNIQEKITLINKIAGEVHILSLNAAVEAASAGKHGKGFAVIASEVRKLSENTTQAGKMITESIEKGVDSAMETTNLVNEIDPLIQELTKGIEEVALDC